ncbi:MAG: winged helix-turn-helix domain-containing protein [Candidatus Omnitrophica bacterium]|nr:winged helix-turn-helix domain-containing protein [Candidatus Omnitrophota bacterium]
MIIEIGIVAGEIWHFLDKNGNSKLDKIVKGLDRPKELILMSLGWLAREGHVTLGKPEDGYLISLTQKNL